jgi:hypothetical protein
MKTIIYALKTQAKIKYPNFIILVLRLSVRTQTRGSESFEKVIILFDKWRWRMSSLGEENMLRRSGP